MLFEETKIIKGCKKGDRAMQKALYDFFAPKMMGVCLRYVADNECARDLLQEGFIRVFTNFAKYSGTGSLEGWIRKVIINTALEYLRKGDVLRNAVELDALEQSSNNKVNLTAIEYMSVNELMEFIYKLPTGYRTVFNLFAIEGYTHKEIAAMLNITESTSRSQYVRAKQMLQKKLLSIEGVGSKAI